MTLNLSGGDISVTGRYRDRQGNLKNANGHNKSHSGGSEGYRTPSLEQGRFLLEVDSEYLGMPSVIEADGKAYVAFKFKDLGFRQVAVLLSNTGGQTRAVGEITNRDPSALIEDLTSIARGYWEKKRRGR